jgi:peptidylprolyl isomerase
MKNIFIYLVVIILVGAAAWLFYLKARKSTDTSILSAPEATATPAAAQTSGENWVKLPNGLQILDVVVGPGQEARQGDMVTAHYTGTLENGTKFDSSYDHGQPFSFLLGGGMVIKGWDLGLVGMKVGGKRKLIIPPSLGYGDKEVGGGVIPANSTLLFDIELMAVETPKK